MSDTLHKKPVNKNNYLLFAGHFHYPYGGWDEIYPTPEEAKEVAESLTDVDWWHIVDLKTRTIARVRGCGEMPYKGWGEVILTKGVEGHGK